MIFVLGPLPALLLGCKNIYFFRRNRAKFLFSFAGQTIAGNGFVKRTDMKLSQQLAQVDDKLYICNPKKQKFKKQIFLIYV